MKRGLVTLALLFALHAANVVAATDCNKQQLENGEFLSSYLMQYAQDCLDDHLQQQLKMYELPTTVVAPTGRHLTLMYPAWKEIGVAFAGLASQADIGSQMRKMYSDLKNRADATLVQLAAVLESNSVPDRSLLGHEAWEIPTNLGLLEIEVSAGFVLPDLPIEIALDSDCRVSEALCQQSLQQGRDLMREWKLADRMTLLFSTTTISAIKDQVVAKDELWKTYLYDSKPMLPLDFVLTDLVTGGWQSSGQLPDGFREPPRTQWFLLHPALGVEYSSGAMDGEQVKPMLYVEIVGANRWNPEHRWMDAPVLRYLSGLSVIASYVDRAGVKDTGYGLLLTFNNVYSLGAARYGEETGIFFSLDLANLVREKYRPKYEKFKDKLRTVRDEI